MKKLLSLLILHEHWSLKWGRKLTTYAISRLGIWLLCAGSLFAQSAAVTFPTAGGSQSLVITLKSTCTTCPSLARVKYVIDDDTVVFGTANNNYTATWDTSQKYNGHHHIVAIALSALDVIIATSPTIRFDIANAYLNTTSPYNVLSAARSPSFAVTDPNTSQVLDTGSNAPSTWVGTVSIPVAVTGATAGEIAAGIRYSINVDGREAIAGGVSPSGRTYTSATPTPTLDTTKFLNGTHLVRILAQYYTGALSNMPAFVWYGMWEGSVTFSNGITPMELRLNTRDKILNVSDTFQITAQVANTDGSLSAASGLTYTSISLALGQAFNPSCTVSGTGLVTATGTGDGTCVIQVQDSNGFQRDGYYYVGTGANVLNYAADSTIQTNWTSKSLFASSIFQNVGQFPSADMSGSLGGDPQYAAYGIASVAAHHNVFESGCGNQILPSDTSAAYLASLTTNYITPIVSLASKYNLHYSLSCDSVFGSNDSIWTNTRGGPATWSPRHSISAFLNAWNGQTGLLSLLMADEVNGKFGTAPLQGLVQIGMPTALGGNFSAISCKSANVQAGATYTGSLPSDVGRVVSMTNASPTYSAPDGTGQAAFTQLHINNDGSGTMTVQPLVGGQFRFGSFTVASGGQTTLVWNPGASLWDTGFPLMATGEACTLSWNPWNLGTGNLKFVLAGATTANVNSAAGSTYLFQKIIDSPDATADNSRFEYVGTGALGNATINAASDPNLRIEWNATWWYNASGQSTDCTADPGNCGAGPSTDYVRWDAFPQVMDDANAVSRPLITWPVLGHTPATAQCAWMGPCTGVGGRKMSDFANFYWATTGCEQIDAFHCTVYQMGGDNTDFAQEMRWRQQIMTGPRAFTAETVGVSLDFGYIGFSLDATSFSNEVVTFAAPHGISTPVPGVSRVAFTGSSNSVYNANFRIDACATATTCNISFALTTFTGTNSSGGTITFEQSGASYALTAGQFSPNVGNQNNAFQTTTGSGCAAKAHVGETATISGSGDANIDASRWLYVRDSPSNCSRQYLRQLPAGSSTGGTSNLLPDNNYHPLWSWSTGGYLGPNAIFINAPWAAMFGAAGERLYTSGGNWSAFDPANGFLATPTAINTLWNSQTGTVQQGIHPFWDIADARRMWFASGNGAGHAARLIKYLYQPKVSAPDKGQFVDCPFARNGAFGNYLGCVNVSEIAKAVAVDFTTWCGASDCRIGGQKILKYTANWQNTTIVELAAGTASDTLTIPAGGIGYYLFPINEAAEYKPPTLTARLADVTGATKVVVRWGYDPYTLDSQTGNVTDCGTGSCALPVDQNFGTVYYRLLYLDTNGKVLATSDIQTL